jgi:ribose/xylose/arabinose/galactoside ABC-type transport system permease subunit
MNSIRRALQSTESGLLLAIVAVVVLTTVLDSQHTYYTYPRPSAVDILRQTSLLGVFTLGTAIVIISGGIDLSSGSVIAFSGTICATIMLLLAPEEMKNATPIGMTTIVVAIAGTLVVGLLIGSLHAWLITVVNLPPFVATLATLVGLRSLGRAIVENVTSAVLSGKSTQIQIFDERFRYLATSVWIPAVLFLVLALATWLLMSRSVIGRHLHALGGNEQAARLSGIRTDQLKWLAYCISALLASIAGLLFIGEESVSDPQRQGRGYELNAIAAAVVGGCSLQGGVGTIPGAVLGALFLRIVIDGVAKIIKTGADVYEGLIVGGVVVVAVAFTQIRVAKRSGGRFFSGPLGLVNVVTLSILMGLLAMLFAAKPQQSGLGVGVVTAVVAFLLMGSAAALEYRRSRAAGDRANE